MSLLQIANLTKTYYMSEELSCEVLTGIDAHFNRGETVALLGESGCGKSTLLNILGGMDSEFGGSVIFDGQFMKDFTPEQMDDYRKTRVGIVFQGFNLISHLNALDNVILPMKMSGRSAAARIARAKELLASMGMTEHAHKLPNQLSGGQRQRVAIARALANDPDIILADEPTGNLDKESAAQIIEILQQIAQNKKLVIIVTHSEAVAAGCMRVITMDDGKFVSTRNNTLPPRKKELKDLPQGDGQEHAAQPISAGELMKFAGLNLWHCRSRTLFVAFGTSVGIIALVLMLALSVGLRGYVNKQVSENVNLLQINVQKNASNGGKSGDTKYFLPEDIDYLSGMDFVERVETSVTLNLSAKYSFGDGSQKLTGDILTLTGSHPGYVPELVSPSSVTLPLAQAEVLISRSMADILLDFGASSGTVNYSSLLRKTVNIAVTGGLSRDFVIVGIIESDDALNSFACCVIAGFVMETLAPSAPITGAYVFVESADYLETVTEMLGYSLFDAYRLDTTIEDILYYIGLGTGVLVTVCAVSLIVSAIMIYIVMNISITERTKEIGILRAIGARSKDVRRIFIFEAGAIGALAGLIGCVVCGIITAAANIVLSVEAGAALISGNPLIYLGGLLIAVAVSVVSGFVPASRASDADPVESLRRE